MTRRALLLPVLAVLAAAALQPRPAAADDDDDRRPLGGFLDRRLKRVVGDVQRRVGISDSQAKRIGKTVKAFRRSAEEISESEEYYLGRAVSAQLLARYPALQDEGLNMYVQSVLQAVAMRSERPELYKGYHAQVLDSDEVNAFAAPGGFVFVTSGLLDLAQDEEELAGVLAHEVAHIAGKHGLKTIKASRLTEAFAILGREISLEVDPKEQGKLTRLFGGSVDDIVAELVTKGYSREKELEADRAAVGCAKAALYDPGGLSRFLGRMREAGARGRRRPGFLKTHPGLDRRLEELEGLDRSSDALPRGPEVRRKRYAAAAAAVER